jgi:hypothetical protein
MQRPATSTMYEIGRLLAADLYGQTFLLADYPTISIGERGELIREKLEARRIRSVLGDSVDRMGSGHAPLTSFRVNNRATAMAYDMSALEALVGRLPFSLEEAVDRTITSLKPATA